MMSQKTSPDSELEIDIDTETSDPNLPVKKNAFLPYPVSTLSPTIVPNDLTNFKSRGISGIQKETAQKMNELRDEYLKVIDTFNWNKLIYESRFGFEPVIGQTYHLYKDTNDTEKGDFCLSLIEPEKWNKPYIGTFHLGSDGRWTVEEVNPEFSLKEYLDNLSHHRS